MSLDGIDCLAPSVTFDIMQPGPPGLLGRDLEERMLRFDYLDEPKKKPTFEFHFDNYDGKIVNMGLLMIGLKIRVTFGYEQLRSRAYTVTITKIKAAPARSPSTESPAPGTWGEITMFGTSEPTKLHWRPDEEHVKLFKNATVSQAVKQLARDAGFRDSKIIVQDGTGFDNMEEDPIPELLVHGNETTRQFLDRMAEYKGFTWGVKNGEFHFHQDNWKAYGSQTIEYFYGPDLLDFSIDGDYNVNVRKVKGSAYDWRKRMLIFMSADPSKSGGRGLGMIDSLESHEELTTVPKGLRQAIATRLLTLSTNRWLVRTSIVGDPRISRGSGMELKNFGPYLDGPWVIISCRHTIDNAGYTTNLGLKHVKNSNGAIDYKLIVMFGPHGERGLAVITDKSYGKQKKGRMQNLGPSKKSKSLTENNTQKITGHKVAQSNFTSHQRTRGF